LVYGIPASGIIAKKAHWICVAIPIVHRQNGHSEGKRDIEYPIFLKFIPSPSSQIT
jgi:hypothetical protein